MTAPVAPAIRNDAAAALRFTPNAEAVERFTDEGRSKAAELSAAVMAYKNAKRDAVADTRRFAVEPTAELPEGDKVPEQWRVQLVGPGGLRATLNDVAHDQLATQLNVPKTLYRRLLGAHPDLLAGLVTPLMHREPATRLFRFLTPVTEEDAQRAVVTGAQMHARGILGPTYRPIDNAELLALVLPVMEAHGAYLRDFALDDRRMHAKFLTVEQSVQAIRERHALKHGLDPARVEARHGHVTVGGRDIAWVDEVVRAGAYLRNSEVGHSSLSVSAVWEILKCLNGMIAAAEAKQRHVGKRRVAGLDDDDLSFLSADAQLLDNASVMARVRDALVAALDERKQVANGELLLAAKAENIVRPPDEPLFQFVENIGSAIGLNESEVATMRDEARDAVRVEGGESRFAIVQSLTATARQMTDYDRRTEYERLGFSWLEDDASALVKLAAEGAKARRN